MRRMKGSLFVAMLALAVVVGAEEVHPDWQVKCAAGDVLIPAGQTWVAYESDMQYINTLGFRGLRILGTLVLDDVETGLYRYPNGDRMLDFHSTGSIVKRGTSTLVMKGDEDEFGGTLIVEEGVFEQADFYAVGGNKESAKIVVRDGATLRINFNGGLGMTQVHAEGDGYGGCGAVVIDKGISGALPYLVLSNDATVVMNGNCGSALSSYTNPGGGVLGTVNPAKIEFNGHKLTLGGTAAKIAFGNLQAVGCGELEVLGLADSAQRALSLSGSTDLGSILMGLPAGVWLTPNAEAIPSAEIDAAGSLVLNGSWNGPISVPADAVLTVVPSASPTVIGGTVSGEGAVSIGTGALAASGMVRFMGKNTYSGTTTVFGDAEFELLLGYPVTDWGKLDVRGGSVLAASGPDADGAPRWSADDVLALAQTLGTSVIKIDVSDATEDSATEISAADVRRYFPLTDPIWSAHGTGTGYYTLTGPYADGRVLNLSLSGGMVRLNGQDTIVLGDVDVNGPNVALTGGMLLLDGAQDVVYGDQRVHIGMNANVNPSGLGRLIIVNSTLRSTSTKSDWGTGSLEIGKFANGVVEVLDGGNLSVKFHLGGGANAGNTDVEGTGVGAIYQRGGEVCARCASSSVYGSCIGFSDYGHGYYELSGGRLTTTGGSLCIGGYSKGVFLQNGGTAEFTTGLLLGAYNKGAGVYSILNGLTECKDSLSLVAGILGGSAVLTVSGAESRLAVTKDPGASVNLVNTQAGWAIINLNDGGVLQMDRFIYSYGDASAASCEWPSVLNFNGGVLRKNSSWPEAVFYTGSKPNVSRVVVYGRGATIDSNGYAVSTAGATFEGATGSGLSSVTLAEPLTGFVAAPYVSVEGAGWGATAVALVDTEQSCVTNIAVTSSGWGYAKESTQIRLYCGSVLKRTLDPSEFEIAGNVAGGFTKTGAGTLSLRNVNTWAQWTKVLGGTLKVGEANALPDGTELTLSNGAVLDLNGNSAMFSGVAGNGGSVAGGTLTLSGEWRVSARRFVERESTEIDGRVDLSGVTRVVLTDTDVLDDPASSALQALNLFSATEVVMPEGGIEISGVPLGWAAKFRGNGTLRLGRQTGLLIMVQ